MADNSKVKVYRYESWSSEDTEKLGYKVGLQLLPGEVVCLDGDLGAGKTAFTKGLSKAFDVEELVTSPTFTIVNEYKGRIPVYHFDVYRINDIDELYEIGFDEYIYGEGISVIEWADKIKDTLPFSYIQILIRKNLDKGDDYREILIERIEREGEEH